MLLFKHYQDISFTLKKKKWLLRKKKDFKRLYTHATFNAHKIVPNSLVKIPKKP